MNKDFRRFLAKFVAAVCLAFVIVIAFLVIQFIFKVASTDITYITYEGTTYECTHYVDNMECVDINDPDVGFGRSE